MIIFGRIWEPSVGYLSGGKGPAIPFLLRDQETGGVKVIINLIKVKEKV